MPEKSDKNSTEKIKLLTKSLDNLTLSGIRSAISRSRNPSASGSSSGSRSRHPSPVPYKHYKQPLKKASPDPLKKPVSTVVVPIDNSQVLEKRFQILESLIQQHHCLIVRSNKQVNEKIEKLRTDQKSHWKKLIILLGSLLTINSIALIVLFSQLKNY